MPWICRTRAQNNRPKQSIVIFFLSFTNQKTFFFVLIDYTSTSNILWITSFSIFRVFLIKSAALKFCVEHIRTYNTNIGTFFVEKEKKNETKRSETQKKRIYCFRWKSRLCILVICKHYKDVWKLWIWFFLNEFSEISRDFLKHLLQQPRRLLAQSAYCSQNWSFHLKIHSWCLLF